MAKRARFLLLLVLLTACQGVRPLNQDAAPPAAVSSALAGSAVAQGTPLSAAQLLSLAADQQMSGEYEAATATLQQVLAQQPEPQQARRARLGLAEAALFGGKPDQAAQELTTFLADGAGDELAARALFLLARAHEDAGNPGGAIEAYTRYRGLHTPLEPYAALRQAAQERAVGRTDQAVALWEYVAQQPIGRARRAEALEALITHYGDIGRTDLQVARYRDLLSISEKPGYRPQVLWRASQVAGATEEARGWLRELVEQYPARAEALDAVAMLEAKGWSAPFVAGKAFFTHERYAEAVANFDVALAGELSAEERFEARRLRALSLRAQARYVEALDELGALAQQRPELAGTAQAELDYIQTAGWSGNIDWAIGGYGRFAERFPQDPLAPEALWRAIQLRQNQGDQQGAMLAALDLGRRYGASRQAHIALTQAGMHFYQTGQRDLAIDAWQLLGAGARGWDSAEGHFWAGNVLLHAGRAEEAGAQLQAADQAAPQSFYGMRARELLGQTDAGSTALGSGPSADEQAAVLAWIAGWTEADAQAAAAEVAQSPEVVRARELGALGLRNEARDEWFAARDAWNEQPLQLWYLALEAHQAQVPYVALKVAERVVALSPEQMITPATPTGILRLVYPTPYTRVVQREAQNFGIDPRIIYALLRQESLFNPDATSWVGARGLGQVMPATGEGIAQNLKVENYSPDLLYRPAVSIRFGAHYISHQLRSFDNNLLAAASAYNGGPGNAARWLENTADRDLFAELIDYRETRDYVKIVYGNYGMYQRLYAP